MMDLLIKEEIDAGRASGPKTKHMAEAKDMVKKFLMKRREKVGSMAHISQYTSPYTCPYTCLSSCSMRMPVHISIHICTGISMPTCWVRSNMFSIPAAD